MEFITSCLALALLWLHFGGIGGIGGIGVIMALFLRKIEI